MPATIMSSSTCAERSVPVSKGKPHELAFYSRLSPAGLPEYAPGFEAPRHAETTTLHPAATGDAGRPNGSSGHQLGRRLGRLGYAQPLEQRRSSRAQRRCDHQRRRHHRHARRRHHREHQEPHHRRLRYPQLVRRHFEYLPPVHARRRCRPFGRDLDRWRQPYARRPAHLDRRHHDRFGHHHRQRRHHPERHFHHRGSRRPHPEQRQRTDGDLERGQQHPLPRGRCGLQQPGRVDLHHQ